MIHAILLDIYQEEVGDEEYAVTFSGTLEDCQAQTNHDGRFETWEKADFHETGSVPIQLEGPTASYDRGRIVSLEEAVAVSGAAFTRMGLPIAIGLAAGMVAGVVLDRITRRRSSTK